MRPTCSQGRGRTYDPAGKLSAQQNENPLLQLLSSSSWHYWQTEYKPLKIIWDRKQARHSSLGIRKNGR
eukprot:257680-Pelagomonas_calceolata.AAC.4